MTAIGHNIEGTFGGTFVRKLTGVLYLFMVCRPRLCRRAFWFKNSPDVLPKSENTIDFSGKMIYNNIC